MPSSNASRARDYLRVIAAMGPYETIAEFYTPDAVIQEFEIASPPKFAPAA
jgi:hypothetical protein